MVQLWRAPAIVSVLLFCLFPSLRSLSSFFLFFLFGKGMGHAGWRLAGGAYQSYMERGLVLAKHVNKVCWAAASPPPSFSPSLPSGYQDSRGVEEASWDKASSLHRYRFLLSSSSSFCSLLLQFVCYVHHITLLCTVRTQRPSLWCCSHHHNCHSLTLHFLSPPLHFGKTHSCTFSKNCHYVYVVVYGRNTWQL